MFRLLFLMLALIAVPAQAQRQNAIQPELVAETRAVAGDTVELAILMHTSPGWHGYWLNPGDAGLPMLVDWQLPPGTSLGPLRYPVPTRLTIAGIMNYVYERDYAVLTRLTVPADASGILHIRAKARWLACTDKICVPEQGEFALDLPLGQGGVRDTRFDQWRQVLPRPLTTPARFEVGASTIKIAIPLPASLEVTEPYVFPAVDGPIDYAGEQRFLRKGDALIAELPRRSGKPAVMSGVLGLADGSGFEFRAVPGEVPSGGTPLGGLGARAILLAVLGALAGGILLNLMPCVFPILGLKAMHLAKSGGDEGHARRDALAYAGGAVIGTGALGLLLLAIRASGSAAGWAFQLQDPRTVLLLTMLATAITLNLLRVFELPVLAGEHNSAGSFGTGALAAFVATPCAGPFLGAALGTALLLPAAGAVLVFAALGLGLAIPFLLIAFIPELRRRLPKPGPWMARLQLFLAIPMAATVVAGLWLLWRLGGDQAVAAGAAAAGVMGAMLAGIGARQRQSENVGFAALGLILIVTAASVAWLPVRQTSDTSVPLGAEKWSEAQVQSELAAGHPVFVYFTADWCLSCKANEAVAIERAEVQAAFKSAGVKVLVGDWTRGDPAITRFLDGRGRAGVPLYLWYEPGREAEELPQILTPSMLVGRAKRTR